MKKNIVFLVAVIALVPLVATAGTPDSAKAPKDKVKVVGKPGRASDIMASQPAPKMPPPPKRDKDGRPIIDMVPPPGSDSAKAAPSDKTSTKDTVAPAKTPAKTSAKKAPAKAPAKKSAR